MIMPWFLPLGVLVGLAGTRTTLRARRSRGGTAWEKDWWLLLALSWLPAFCWLMAQFVRQDF